MCSKCRSRKQIIAIAPERLSDKFHKSDKAATSDNFVQQVLGLDECDKLVAKYGLVALRKARAEGNEYPL